MINRRICHGVALALALVCGVGGPASANNHKGRYVHHQQVAYSLDGISARIRMDTNSPGSGTCQVFSVIASSDTGRYQLQAGVGRCKTLSIGDCGFDGFPFRFIETQFAGSYKCYEHGNFNLGSPAVAFNVARQSATSSVFHAYIGGVRYEGTSGIPANETILQSWGESAGADKCGPSFGVFSDHKRSLYGVGTFTLTGYPLTYPVGQTCWSATTPSNGYYEVSS